MAHNLNQTASGEYAFAYVEKTAADRPWHNLGQSVSEAMTTSECMIKAHLNYNIIQEIAAYNHKKNKRFIDDWMVNIREDNGDFLGMVRKSYQLIQNSETFQFFDALMGEKEAPIFQTAGALGNGERIFVTAKMPSHIVVEKNGVRDGIEKYVFLTSSHDGSAATICGMTPIRIVCNNTLTLALKGLKQENFVKIKHTKNAQENLRQAHKVLGMINTTADASSEIFNKMARVKITDVKLQEFIAAVMSPKAELISKDKFEELYSSQVIKVTDQIMEYAIGHDTQKLETTKGTLFGAYNAITGYYQNIKEWESDEVKFDNMIISDAGTAKKKMAKAFEMAVAMI